MIQTIHTSVLVIGSGPAGYSAAFRSADLGLKTILVEKYDSLGGVCLNVGCIPSKFLLHIAKIIKESKEIKKSGIFFNPPKIDIDILRSHKEKIIYNLSEGIKYLAKNRKVTIIHGIASFIDLNKISIIHHNKIIHVSFDNIILATGSTPIKLSNIPVSKKYIWDSNQALSLKSIPNRLLIIGSGIIGLEMATFYSAIGTKVDVIDRCKTCLPFLDRDVINIFSNSIKKDFDIFLDTEIINVELKKNGVFVTTKNSLGIKEIFYDAILLAVGRKPNLDLLDLNKVGIELNETGFIRINNQLRTNHSHIYAIGDIVGHPILAHKGMHQGHIVSEIIAGNKHYFDPIVIPSVAYTDPEIAWVGMSEQEAIKKKINFEISIFPWKASGRAIATYCENGITKLIINKDNNKIIGGVIIGRQAGELVSEITLAIEMGCDIEDLALTIHAHPTLYESIGLAAQLYQGSITDLLNSKSYKIK